MNATPSASPGPAHRRAVGTSTSCRFHARQHGSQLKTAFSTSQAPLATSTLITMQEAITSPTISTPTVSGQSRGIAVLSTHLSEASLG